jgi:RNA polymerase subunit RPABC4/transcription elongation factor Spt4
VAPKDDKRIKFCRYCDGVIEWGTEVCPHCGETLKVTKFDDLDFVTGPTAPPAAAKPPPKRAPEEDAEIETVEFESLDIPSTVEMPTLKPVFDDPPVMKPLPADPPVVKPIAPAKPVVRRGGPPVMKPLKPGGVPAARPGKKAGRPPVMKPIAGDPPVVQPVSAAPSEPPVMAPIGGAGVPAGVVPVAENCPVCNEVMVIKGGTCLHCGKTICAPCLMRSNGMRAGRVMEMNRVRWSDRSKKMGPDAILCPACGDKGVGPPE